MPQSISSSRRFITFGIYRRDSKVQQTMIRQRTDVTTDVRYVQNRVYGDLLAIHEAFGIDTKEHMYKLAHDVGLGLSSDCLGQLSLFLYQYGCFAPHRVYRYRRVAPGSFDHSSHSGRITRDANLFGGRLESEIALINRSVWEELKTRSQLYLRWGPCVGRSTYGMRERSDGGYASGEVGFSRTCLIR